MKLKPSIFLTLFVFILIIICSFIYKTLFAPKFQIIKINKTEILAEIANTPEEKTKGLSGRNSLPKNQGMLFLFKKPGYYSFWMQNTFISLDVIWIKNKEIVEITQNVRPEDYQPPKVLTPKTQVDAVLEVNAGLVKELNIKLGEEIIF